MSDQQVPNCLSRFYSENYHSSELQLVPFQLLMSGVLGVPSDTQTPIRYPIPLLLSRIAHPPCL